MFDLLERIRNAWDNGSVVLLYDASHRKNEVQMIYPGRYIEPHHIFLMRKDAGGTIEAIISYEFGKLLGLPLINVIYEGVRTRYNLLDKLLFEDNDTRHNRTISFHTRGELNPDTDRSKSEAFQEFGKLADEILHNNSKDEQELFAKQFTSPGVLSIKIGHHALLRQRQGHAELGLALMEITNHIPFLVKSTMLSENGKLLSIEKAKSYAIEHELELIEGKTVLNLWRSIKKIQKDEILVDEL